MSLTAGSVSVDINTATVTYTPNNQAMAGIIFDAMKAALDATNKKIKLPPDYKAPPKIDEMDPGPRAAMLSGIAGLANGMASGMHTILTTKAVVSGSSIT